MAKARASIRDVARESGVSLTTVSLILNKNDQRISEATRSRVRQAMERLEYTPSRLARGLPNRRSNMLAVLVPPLQHAFADVYFGEIISGIHEVASQGGFRLLLEVASPEFLRRREYTTLLEDCSVDGILFIGATDEHAWLADFDGSDKPLLVVNNRFTQWDLHHVVCDYRAAGALAAARLAELGHTRIAHIGGSHMVATSREVRESFSEELLRRGVRLKAEMVLDGEYQIQGGKAACDELLRRDPGLSAVFTANDKMAIGVYQSLREHRLTPGRDVSVIGCDDVPQSALLDPPLSTIRLDFFGVGRRACEAMLGVLDDRGGARIAERMAVELIDRESCAPVR